MQVSEEYAGLYQALNPELREIRILHVKESGNDEEIVDATLETVSLLSDPKPRYEAMLSTLSPEKCA